MEPAVKVKCVEVGLPAASDDGKAYVRRVARHGGGPKRCPALNVAGEYWRLQERFERKEKGINHLASYFLSQPGVGMSGVQRVEVSERAGAADGTI